MKAQAIVFTGVNRPELCPVELPEPADGELLVEISYSCVSPGTELRCLAGEQAGVTFPFIPGYTQSGVVLRGGANTSTPPGTRVFCRGTTRADVALAWGGHVSHAIVQEQGATPLADSIDPLEASAIKLAAIAYHGLRQSKPQPHERVAVVGLGAIGQCAARLHTLTGAHVTAFDTVPSRVELARGAGVRAETVTGDLAQAVRAVYPDGVDVIVDATGVAGLLPTLLSVAKDLAWDDSLTPGARYVIQGSYPKDFAVPYQEAFLKEIQWLIPRDQQPRDLRAVIDLLERGTLRLRDLISTIARPQDAPQIYADLQARRAGMMTAAFAWQSA
jgi:2-desacetyl-2-hydroxyethyl bacteriochlorophyllide A dehydrogenase